MLAPTGKAALRVRNEGTDANVETIDRWVNRSGLRQYLDNLSRLTAMKHSKYCEPVENLIIDEVSMVDLPKLAVVFRALEVHEPDIRRVILVGDEHQLPPIGMGRPLFDLLEHLNSDPAKAAKHIVRLRSNCRQRQDRTVVDAAYLFAGKNRYHTDLYARLLEGGEISPHLRVEYWQDSEDLVATLSRRLNDVIRVEDGADTEECEKALNRLFNLYETGFAGDQRNEETKLKLEAWQLLSTYRDGPAGTLAANQSVREQYRAGSFPESRFDKSSWFASAFGHSDKIIRTSNYYEWNSEINQKELRLSNGSIGVLCSNRWGRTGYFPELPGLLEWKTSDEENFEPAYAITVHKSQGSEFGDVFVVIPERQALLSRELFYTAMTRSTAGLTLLVQKSERKNPLQVARERSDLLRRNSSLFTHPCDSRRVYEPEQGIRVKSKIEYLIYEALRQAREENLLTFKYEEELELPFGDKRIVVHPDFTVRAGGRTYRWEHLGMLDRDDYSSDWQERREAYEKEGLIEELITTDDMYGVRNDQVRRVIEDMVAGTLSGTSDEPFSQCHYRP